MKGLTKYDIKELKIAYEMALSDPKYNENHNKIIKILASEYNVTPRIVCEILGYSIHEDIINNLKTLRLLKNLTQQEVAKSTGLNYQTIGSIERNKHIPRRKSLIKLLEFYGVPIKHDLRYYSKYEKRKIKLNIIRNDLFSEIKISCL
ncbi:helix-turn-helix transcriptional regulator [Cytobacillus firmus]|nr:helix-turn-helix transcriptional regulator [Cytobacillus firmus]